MSVTFIPQFRYKTIDLLEDGQTYTKTFIHSKLISLPSEYAFYLNKFKRVYRIELSHSTKRWVLTADDGSSGWEQRGWYIRTLCAAIGWRPENDIQRAIDIASKLLPEEKAFYYPEGMQYNSNDPEFEEFWENIQKPGLTLEQTSAMARDLGDK